MDLSNPLSLVAGLAAVLIGAFLRGAREQLTKGAEEAGAASVRGLTAVRLARVLSAFPFTWSRSLHVAGLIAAAIASFSSLRLLFVCATLASFLGGLSLLLRGARIGHDRLSGLGLVGIAFCVVILFVDSLASGVAPYVTLVLALLASLGGLGVSSQAPAD